MACKLLENWIVHYDPIHRGYTPAGIANGVTATAGWSFPRVAGGYNLYRGTGSVASIDEDHPVGAAGRNATSIANFQWRPHAASTLYWYAVKSIGGGGVQSALSAPSRVAEFDSGGGLVGLRPDAPSGLAVTPKSGGAFEVRWLYEGRLAEAVPDHFELYHDNGTGTVDYATVVASVSYRAGRVHDSFVSGAFSHDVRRIWAVRAVTSGGVDDGNGLVAAAWSDAQAPVVHPGVRSVCLAEEA